MLFRSFGIPKDADLLLDVRFLPNPFYIPELRNKTGNDKEVYDYVMEKPETQEFIKRTLSYYDYLLKEYEKAIENKRANKGENKKVSKWMSIHISRHIYEWKTTIRILKVVYYP